MWAEMCVTVYTHVKPAKLQTLSWNNERAVITEWLTSISADVSAYQGLITEAATRGSENLIASVNVWHTVISLPEQCMSVWHNAAEIWGIFETGTVVLLFFWQDCHTLSVSWNNSHFPFRCDSLSSSWADDGNNTQGGLSDDALIWCDSKRSAGWQRQSFGCAHSRPDSLQDTPPSDRQHISRLDISTCDKRSVALKQSYDSTCELINRGGIHNNIIRNKI